MDPLTAAAAGTAATGGAALPLMIGGAAVAGLAQLVGMYMQSGQADKARAAIENAVAQYGPEAYGIIEQELGGPSAMAEVYGERLAPEAAAAQKAALRRLQQISETGYTPEEEAALRRIQAQTAAMASSQQAALQGQLQRQGVLDSGARIAMQQAAGQAAANRAAQQGLDVAAQAQRRALQSLQAQGSLGGQMRGQAFGEAQARAAAEEQKRLNRAQMKSDVARGKAGMLTGSAEAGYKYGTLPGQQVAGIGTAIGTPFIAAGAKKWSEE